MSDEESHVIREFAILNVHMHEDHHRYGIPYPGTYMIGNDGIVFAKSFFAEHGVRESINDLLQESYRVDGLDHGEVQVITTDHLTARAYFTSPTIRSRQKAVLTVEVSLADGLHVYGRPLPEGYIPVELAVDGGEDLVVDGVDYPESEEMSFEALGERLPAYTGRFEIKARCIAVKRSREAEEIPVSAELTYQACDDRECFMPQTLNFSLPLQFLPHAR